MPSNVYYTVYVKPHLLFITIHIYFLNKCYQELSTFFIWQLFQQSFWLICSNGREARNRAEKNRRDKLTQAVHNLSGMIKEVRDSPRRVDKTAVLRFAAHGIRIDYRKYRRKVLWCICSNKKCTKVQLVLICFSFRQVEWSQHSAAWQRRDCRRFSSAAGQLHDRGHDSRPNRVDLIVGRELFGPLSSKYSLNVKLWKFWMLILLMEASIKFKVNSETYCICILYLPLVEAFAISVVSVGE